MVSASAVCLSQNPANQDRHSNLQSAACRQQGPGWPRRPPCHVLGWPQAATAPRDSCSPRPPLPLMAHFGPSSCWQPHTYRCPAQLGSDVGDGVVVLLQDLTHRDVGPFGGDVEHQHHPRGHPCRRTTAEEVSAGTLLSCCPTSQPPAHTVCSHTTLSPRPRACVRIAHTEQFPAGATR